MSLYSDPKWLEALVVYAEPLVSGRRVIVFGDASSGLAGHLVRAGARLVHVYDLDAARAGREAANQLRGVVVRALTPEAEFDVREGAFELALIPEFQEVRSIADLPAKVRRLVGQAGACIAATRSSAADAPEYYELYDAVSLQFASVQMLGLLPFGGLTFAELGESEGKGVSVDTQLLSDVPLPQRFIAIAGQRDTRLDAYTIVQTDAGNTGASVTMLEELRVKFDESSSRGTNFEREAVKLRDELNRVQSRAGDNHVRAERLNQDLRQLEEELEKQRARGFKLTREVEEERKLRQKAEVELGMSRGNPELQSGKARVAELEAALRELRDAAPASPGLDPSVLAASERAVAEVNARAEQLHAQLEQANHAVARSRSRIDDVERQLMGAAKALEEAEARAIQAEAQEQRLAVVAEQAVANAETYRRTLAEQGGGYEAELQRFEEVLRERAKQIQQLEHEVLRRERLVKELLSTLEELGASHASPDQVVALERQCTGLVREVDHQAQRAAQLEQHGNELKKSLLERQREQAQTLGEIDALHGKLDALALETARREGDLQASFWRVAELEGQLASKSAAQLDHADQIARARAEIQAHLVTIDELRRVQATVEGATAAVPSEESPLHPQPQPPLT